MKLRATLALREGSALTTIVLKNVPLQPGTPLTVGTLHLKIASFARGTGADKDKWELELDSPQPLDQIKTLTILGKDGKRMDLNGFSPDSGESSSNDVFSYSITYDLRKKMTHATLKVAYYSHVEIEPVAINTITGVGL